MSRPLPACWTRPAMRCRLMRASTTPWPLPNRTSRSSTAAACSRPLLTSTRLGLPDDLISYGNAARWDFETNAPSPDGTLLGIPINGNIQLYYYRTDIFEERGLVPPTTFDEMAAIAEEVNDPPNLFGNANHAIRFGGSSALMLTRTAPRTWNAKMMACGKWAMRNRRARGCRAVAATGPRLGARRLRRSRSGRPACLDVERSSGPGTYAWSRRTQLLRSDAIDRRRQDGRYGRAGCVRRNPVAHIRHVGHVLRRQFARRAGRRLVWNSSSGSPRKSNRSNTHGPALSPRVRAPMKLRERRGARLVDSAFAESTPFIVPDRAYPEVPLSATASRPAWRRCMWTRFR